MAGQSRLCHEAAIIAPNFERPTTTPMYASAVSRLVNALKCHDKAANVLVPSQREASRKLTTHLILHMPMEAVPARFTQLIAQSDKVEAARALKPVFAETRFGQTVFVFDGADQAALEPLGTISTPTLSDLFVALMSRDTGVK